jgi:EAL domain-containing protein (putative c-di-GMP-specific phosphodiesterase class I)
MNAKTQSELSRPPGGRAAFIVDDEPQVRSFISKAQIGEGCSTDERKRSMCQSVIDVARRSNLAAVAEGVETADDLQTLIAMGYDMAQGFYFAKPMESGAFAEMLMSPRPVQM